MHANYKHILQTWKEFYTSRKSALDLDNTKTTTKGLFLPLRFRASLDDNIFISWLKVV